MLGFLIGTLISGAVLIVTFIAFVVFSVFSVVYIFCFAIGVPVTYRSIILYCPSIFFVSFIWFYIIVISICASYRKEIMTVFRSNWKLAKERAIAILNRP